MGPLTPHQSRHNVHRGFTLIELMIVVIVVGVLLAIALPAYNGYVVKANRGAAQAYLLDIAQKQQLFFNDTRRYAQDANELSVIQPPRVADNYRVTFSVDSDPNTPPAFVITAAPESDTPQAVDGALVVDSNGNKTRAGGSW